MRFNFYRIRSYLPHIITVVVALSVALLSWQYLQNYVTTHQEMIRLPVPTHDIEPYTKITAKDLAWREFIKGSEDPTTVRTPGEVVGKITIAKLLEGRPIDTRILTGGDYLGGRQVVGVNVDPTRAATVKPGDLVDIYWLAPEKGAWEPLNGVKLIASNVRVLKVCDENGAPMTEDSGVLKAKPKKLAIVYLAVEPEDVPEVIAGSAPASTNIAFAKKAGPTASPSRQDKPSGGEEGVNAEGAEKGTQPSSQRG